MTPACGSRPVSTSQYSRTVLIPRPSGEGQATSANACVRAGALGGAFRAGVFEAWPLAATDQAIANSARLTVNRADIFAVYQRPRHAFVPGRDGKKLAELQRQRRVN